MAPLKIIPQMTFGNWTVIERDYHPSSKQHSTFWFCRCELCGQIYSVSRDSLVRGTSQCCNSCKGVKIKQILIEKGITKYDIQPNDVFGYLTALTTPYKRKDRQSQSSYVRCRCRCGNEIEVRKSHLVGPQNSRGRTISCGCASESSGEIKIRQILQDNKIDFERQYRIQDFNINSPFDFALFKNKKLIGLLEFDGEQHFKAIEHFGGMEKFQLQQQRDLNKDIWCKNNNIRLIRIPYIEYDNITIEYLLSFFPELIDNGTVI